MSTTEEFRDWELSWGVQAVVAPVPHKVDGFNLAPVGAVAFVVVQYADQAAYEKTQAAIAQDGECQQVFVEIARFATRVSREMVIDLDL